MGGLRTNAVCHPVVLTASRPALLNVLEETAGQEGLLRPVVQGPRGMSAAGRAAKSSASGQARRRPSGRGSPSTTRAAILFREPLPDIAEWVFQPCEHDAVDDRNALNTGHSPTAWRRGQIGTPCCCSRLTREMAGRDLGPLIHRFPPSSTWLTARGRSDGRGSRAPQFARLRRVAATPSPRPLSEEGSGRDRVGRGTPVSIA